MATITVGGFTIRASVGTAGPADVFFDIQRGGARSFAFADNSILKAVYEVQAKSGGGNDQEVIQWINSGGPAQLVAQAKQSSAPPEPLPTEENTSDNTDNDDSGDNPDQANTTSETSTSEPSSPAAPNNNPTVVPETKTQRPQSENLFNPLRNFSSHTYNISLYALTPDAYNAYVETGVWDTSRLDLIVQSGGINSSNKQRNKWFEYDFGIDNLEITSILSSKETSIATVSIDFKFQIHEPFTMTFPTRIVSLQQELQTTSAIPRRINQQIEALHMPFLLVVGFVGYNDLGEIANNLNTTAASNTSDSTNFSRAFPILFSKFQFRLDNKTTIYDIQAKTLDEQIAFGAKRSIVLNPLTISADTVGSAIGGTDTNTEGLIDKVNQSLEDLRGKTEQEEKVVQLDTYKVEFLDDNIKDSLIVEKDFWTKTRAPLQNVTDPKQVNAKLAQAAQQVQRAKRQIEIATGTPILMAIDQIIAQSNYVTDSLLTIDIEPDPATEDGRTTQENPNPKPLQWYIVIPKIKYKLVPFDDKRQDYAYDITYQIKTYDVPYVRSNYIDHTNQYPGPAKIYRYLYTGQNTEVLKYDQQYNMLYFNAIATGSTSGIKDINNTVPAHPFYMNSDNTGKESGKFELPNSIRTDLYSPGDQIRAQIQILGDPDFLIPNYGKEPVVDPYQGQIFMEIDFKQVDDYNVTTNGSSRVFQENGLLAPNNNIRFWDYPPDVEEKAKGKMIYLVMRVVSKFSNGVFTQDLRTVIPNFSKDLGKTEPSSEFREEGGDTNNRSGSTSTPSNASTNQSTSTSTSAPTNVSVAESLSENEELTPPPAIEPEGRE